MSPVRRAGRRSGRRAILTAGAPTRSLVLALVVALVAAACSGTGDPSGSTPEPGTVTTSVPGDAATTTAGEGPGTTTATTPPDARFRATVRWTADGVPHVSADDWGGLGFGHGYAFATRHLCSLADVVVQARSEAARFFGPGPDDRWLDQDLVYAALDLRERAVAAFAAADPEVQEVITGYAAGYNAHLDEVGVDGVGGYCAGEPWVGPIDAHDLAAHYLALAWRASVDPLVGSIAAAQPPAVNASVPVPGGGDAPVAAGNPPADPVAAFAAAAAGLAPDATALASNAWAVGPDRTEEGTTMLVGNPHFPWQGALRFFEVHLTLPGELDVYGVSLLGSPAVNIGFTSDVAWSHTASAGHRFTAYTLDLAPGDPTRYVYGGTERAMTTREVSVEVLGQDGATRTVERTFWFSHYGPILDFPGVGWTDAVTLTFRDANADNDELLPQFLAMNAASDLEELIDAHATWQGIPWVNTIAASSDGRVWYADTSATPNLSDEAIAAWEARVESDPLTAVALDTGVVLLDGSDPVYEWVDDPDARDPGLVPFERMPRVERTDVVFNANDPYWVATLDEVLTGYSPLHGRAGTPLSNRTRMNAVQLGSAGGDAGPDGRFSRVELRDSAIGNRVFTAEALLDQVVERCRAEATATGDDGTTAAVCEVLDGWDRRVDLGSEGAALWREFLATYETDELIDAGPLWDRPFDPADPIGTPVGLAEDPELVERLLAAAGALTAAGFDLDALLGELQYAERAGERVPVHGGTGAEGVTNVVGFGTNDTTSEAGVERGPVIDGSRSLTPAGYPVASGTSFLFVVEFTSDGPVAEAFLTYGNTGDPTDPAFVEATRRFSDGDWRTVRFTEDEVAADPELVTVTVSGD